MNEPHIRQTGDTSFFLTGQFLGGCHDFKVVTSLSSDKFGDWAEKKFAPEEDFIAKLKDIDGIDTGKSLFHDFVYLYFVQFRPTAHFMLIPLSLDCSRDPDIHAHAHVIIGLKCIYYFSSGESYLKTIPK